MEDAGGKGGIGMSLGKDITKVLLLACSAACNDGGGAGREMGTTGVSVSSSVKWRKIASQTVEGRLGGLRESSVKNA